MKNSWAILVVIFCMFLSSTEVEARKGLGVIFKLGRSAKALNGVKHYNSNTLTVEELRACLLLEQKVDKSDEQLSFEKVAISKKEENIKQLKSEITSLKRYLVLNQNANVYTQQQVDVFNNKVERYNKLISIYNTEIESYKAVEKSYNLKVTQHNSLVNQFQYDCAGKRYYEDDLAAATATTNK